MNREQDLQTCYEDVIRLLDEQGASTMDEMLEVTDWCPIHRDAVENMVKAEAIEVINSCAPYHYFNKANWRFRMRQFDESPTEIEDVVELGED